MTKLETRRTRLQFETADEHRERGQYRAVMVEAHPQFITLRLKGCRRAVSLSWAGVYSLAIKLEVERARAEKRAQRKAKR